MRPDLTVRSEGSIFLLLPCTPAGDDWVAQNIEHEGGLSWGRAIVIEHRYIENIVRGAIADGLVVR
jgi:hypothetical protein